MSHPRNKYKPTDPEIDRWIDQHGRNPEAILEIFQDIQAERHGLSREVILDVAKGLQIPAQAAYGVASFYSMLNLEPGLEGKVIRVCDGPVCWLKHARQVHQSLEEVASQSGWIVERTSCLGLCDRAPAALVGDEQAGPLSPSDVANLQNGWLGVPVDYSHPRPGEVRVMMAQAGMIDPDSIQSALAHGAYEGLKKAMSQPAEQVIANVENSGLTGRGGAGFPVGRKWRFVAQAGSMPHYIVCNADESEPLIFKDRVLIDTNPHQILEGIAIAGYATGSHEAFIYIRGEYKRQAERLERAILQAEESGYLGDHLLGSEFSLHIHVHRGAGAYICGEETALIESLEGKRGEPRFRPPYPPTYGYQGQPTLVNNVESYAAVPAILTNGSEWYRQIGATDGKTQPTLTPGTKMYMLLGDIQKPGLFEAPFGLTLRQFIDRFGGGMLPGSEFRFALTGGAAGTIVPPSLLDIPIDYSSAGQGVSLGAGAFLICDQYVSPVAFLRELVHFFAVESCGKCNPCRLGTIQSLEILDRLVAGLGDRGDVERLGALADVMQVASFCGLGQAVAIPVRSALKHFGDEFLSTEKPY
jgi:NADH:ubiquinone oxidoreductase subunit F (NADH-binding)/NADH:ubiquinone oxidoreductase subunit E